jgi:hypothetical protein
MRRVDQREAVDVVGPALQAYNKVHAGKRIKVEWRIGGLKMRWRILNGTWTNRRQKFATTMRACAILTNFLHRCRMNMAIEEADIAVCGAWGNELSDQDE